jgi:biopolymer transport protein ExbD
MSIKRARPEINAGSMADIAFLLLIFFLVTTTMDADKGIQRKLPQWNPDITSAVTHQRNVLTILVNSNDKLLIEDEYASLEDVKESSIRFLDNNHNGSCTYCQGKGHSNSSDAPSKAVISIQNDRNTSYKLYVAVQNEVTAAYNTLREREAQKLFGQEMGDLNAQQKKIVISRFPMKISEAETVNF